MKNKGFLSHSRIPAEMKRSSLFWPLLLPFIHKVYCWRVAPQQSSLPLQLY